MGFVSKVFQLMPHLTALENAMLPLELAGRRDARARAEMLQRGGFWASACSCAAPAFGGERQRVALARALWSRPPAVLLAGYSNQRPDHAYRRRRDGA